MVAEVEFDGSHQTSILQVQVFDQQLGLGQFAVHVTQSFSRVNTHLSKTTTLQNGKNHRQGRSSLFLISLYSSRSELHIIRALHVIFVCTTCISRFCIELTTP